MDHGDLSSTSPVHYRKLPTKEQGMDTKHKRSHLFSQTDRLQHVQYHRTCARWSLDAMADQPRTKQVFCCLAPSARNWNARLLIACGCYSFHLKTHERVTGNTKPREVASQWAVTPSCVSRSHPPPTRRQWCEISTPQHHSPPSIQRNLLTIQTCQPKSMAYDPSQEPTRSTAHFVRDPPIISLQPSWPKKRPRTTPRREPTPCFQWKMIYFVVQVGHLCGVVHLVV